MAEYRFEAALWQWSGKGSWHFITVPENLSGIIRMAAPQKAGFGSVRVSAGIGGVVWKTSLFPDTKSGCYLLPVKAAVRKQCAIKAGDVVEVVLDLID